MIVEDGTNVTDADSYVSVSYADDYHSNRGNTAWTGTDTVKEQALIKATDYVQQRYNGKWQSTPTYTNQSLDWPRFNVKNVDSNEIPNRLKQAVCILALESFTTDLNPVLDRAIKREKVDVIETEYMDNARAGVSRPAIDGMLRPFMWGGSMMGRTVRV